jgi:phage protein D
MAFETSGVRQSVSGFLSVNGQNMLCTHLSVTKTGKRRGDTFSATIPIDASAGFSEAFWASQTSIEATAIFSAGGQQQPMVAGNVDEISIDWLNRSVHVSGRDKSSKLTESRVNKKYTNQKSSDIVKDLAQMSGLQAQVSSSGGGDDVSKKYDIDTVHLILNRTPFEAISILAEREGVRWFVDGNTLYFGAQQSGGAYPIEYQPPQSGYITSNTTTLTTRRNLVAARDVESTVKSWHHKDKKLYQYTAKAPAAQGAHASQKRLLGYEMHYPGMNQQQVETLAKTRANETIRHEMGIEVRMPGDLSLDVTQQIALSGTGTLFDQNYDIDELSFYFESGEEGSFSMEITGKAASQGRSAS